MKPGEHNRADLAKLQRTVGEIRQQTRLTQATGPEWKGGPFVWNYTLQGGTIVGQVVKITDLKWGARFDQAGQFILTKSSPGAAKREFEKRYALAQ